MKDDKDNTISDQSKSHPRLFSSIWSL